MNQSYLWQKLGKNVQQALSNDAINEIALNDDGKLWLLHAQNSWQEVDKPDVKSATAFVHALAQSLNTILNEKQSYLDAVLPFNGERINITVPPITASTSFNIRKRAKRIYTLEHCMQAKIISAYQYQILHDAIKARKNILISGGPGTGKTTFANALLAKMRLLVPAGHRVLVLEDTKELQCSIDNSKSLQTTEYADMRCLLWLAMRNSPDRIVVGEVRDGAALDLLKAWNTGCPGGIATIHANSPKAALQRLLDLSQEAINVPPTTLAAEAIDVIVQLEFDSSIKAGRSVSKIIKVREYCQATQEFCITEMENQA